MSPVEFVSYDDQSEPTKTAQLYERMITRENVNLILNPYGTPFHIALGPAVNAVPSCQRAPAKVKS